MKKRSIALPERGTTSGSSQGRKINRGGKTEEARGVQQIQQGGAKVEHKNKTTKKHKKVGQKNRFGLKLPSKRYKLQWGLMSTKKAKEEVCINN